MAVKTWRKLNFTNQMDGSRRRWMNRFITKWAIWIRPRTRLSWSNWYEMCVQCMQMSSVLLVASRDWIESPSKGLFQGWGARNDGTIDFSFRFFVHRSEKKTIVFCSQLELVAVERKKADNKAIQPMRHNAPTDRAEEKISVDLKDSQVQVKVQHRTVTKRLNVLFTAGGQTNGLSKKLTTFFDNSIGELRWMPQRKWAVECFFFISDERQTVRSVGLTTMR